MSRNNIKITSDMMSKFWYSLKAEYSFIFRDIAVVFSILIVPIMVSFVYTYIYSHQVINDLPIAVVDQDNTTESRLLTRMMDATEPINASYVVSNFSEAEELYDKGNVRGIVTIPYRFGRDLNRKDGPAVSVYADASYILYYKQVYKAAAIALSYMNAGVELKLQKAKGNTADQAAKTVQPIQTKVVSMFNPDSGYAIFVMPAVFLVVIQTTLLTGIGLLGGTFREKKKFHNVHSEIHNLFDALAVVLGKAFAYTTIGFFVLIIIVGFVLPAYDMPQRGNVLELFVYAFPYILSIGFLGITLNRFLRHREDAAMTIIFTSIPVLLICGVSWPEKEIPVFLMGLSKIIPSALSTKGFVAISQAGSSLLEVKDLWIQEWVLCAFYFVLAVFSMKRLVRKGKVEEAMLAVIKE